MLFTSLEKHIEEERETEIGMERNGENGMDDTGM